jgi:hypothetical protein
MASPETANNAAVSGGLVPLISLGIPPNAVMAVLVFCNVLMHVFHQDIAWMDDPFTCIDDRDTKVITPALKC